MQLIIFIPTEKVAAETTVPMWQPTFPTQPYQLIFLRVHDEYQVRYAISGLPTGTHTVKANFWSDQNRYYSVIFNNPTGIAYLTCNGTYILEMLDVSGNKLQETAKIVTHKIENPSCDSYEKGSLKNPLNAWYDAATNTIEWDEHPQAFKYHIYKDGESIATLTSFGSTRFEGRGDGIYTIEAVGTGGQSLSLSDVIVGSGGNTGINDGNSEGESGGDDGGNDGGESGCDACTWLTDALACPAWDEYMGELTNAIRDALPPPTDWNSVASIFVDQFADYFGSVPNVPTKQSIEQQIQPQQPPLNTSVPDADITPIVPSDFNNGVLDTSITGGEVIEIKQESQAFEIYEPDEFNEHDDPGVMVFPNDPRNSSNGIKTPDQVETGYQQPTPQPVQMGDVPPSDIPLPNETNGITPTPNSQDYIIPIPQISR